MGTWVGPRIGLDDVGKRKILPLPGLELRYLGLPGRSQSLYRRCYPGLNGRKLCVKHALIKNTIAKYTLSNTTADRLERILTMV
jgi:hypothetical protein